jgi:Protein of unknown function (DUF3592)
VKALKIVGTVLGILLLLTGGGLIAGSALADKGQGAFNKELARSGYAGPVQGTVQSVDQTNPVTITVSYTDDQGKKHTGRGGFAGGDLPQIGDTVSTYYSTSDPDQVVVVDLPGLGNLGAVVAALRTAGVVCMISGGVLLLAGILGLALGKKQPAAAGSGAWYPSGSPQQSPTGYPTHPYPPQPPAGRPYPTQPYPPQSQPGQYPPQQSSGQPYPPHDPPQR